MALGVQYSGIWTMAQQFQAVGAGQWKGIAEDYLYTWGDNASYGNIGDNTTQPRSSPVQIGSLTTWSQIDGGDRYSMALKTDGTMWTWGMNGSGRLGDNTVIYKSSPVQIGSLTSWSQISAGNTGHSMALKTDGTLWTFGYNNHGSLGDNTVIKRSSPIQVGALTTWSKISAGYHSMALKTDGTMWLWGKNSEGQLGDNTLIYRSSPIQVGSLTTWSQIAAASNHSMALKTDGTLWAWGYDDDGMLGDNKVAGSYRSSPVQIGSLTTWSQISANAYHSMALKTDGTMWTWGNNSYGHLGANDRIFRSSPVQIGALTTWSKIAGAGSHSMAIKTDGTMWLWGYGNDGRLGDGTVGISRSSPVQIGSLTTWSKIAGGIQFSMAISHEFS